MKRALISDIHGNFEALVAVMEDIALQEITEIYCLGDVIGYGPNPCECLDRVLQMDVCILGNHDQAAMFDPDGFNPVALRAIYWTRHVIDQNCGNPAAVHRRWDFLGGLPPLRREGNFLFVHGSPRDPTNEYVFPEHACDERRMKNLFRRVDQYCFQGHTHIPGIFTEHGDFLTPEDCHHQFPLSEEKLMCNVGSVGQPRDGDPRSCYLVLHDDHVEFRRVEYPLEDTIEKIYRIPDLDNMLGDRLRSGR